MKKGFTLVEMLAVIIILSLFSLIGIISVESIIKKGTEKSYQAQIGEIKTAAENLVKIEGLPSWCEGNICFISLRYLAFNNHLKLKDITYTALDGDTFESIAAKFNFTKEEIQKYNSIDVVKKGTEIKIPASKSYGEYTNPKTEESFPLETVVMVKKYGENYTFEAFASMEELSQNNASYLNQAKREALFASAIIYKKLGLCTNTICTMKTSDLVKKNLLEKNFYSEVNITVDNSDNVSIG